MIQKYANTTTQEYANTETKNTVTKACQVLGLLTQACLSRRIASKLFAAVGRLAFSICH